MSGGSNCVRVLTFSLYRRYRGHGRTSLSFSQPPSSSIASSFSTQQETPTRLNPHSSSSSSSSSSDNCYCCCNHHVCCVGGFPSKPVPSFCSMTLRHLSTTTSQEIGEIRETHVQNEKDEEVEPIDIWEEEDDAEPEIGDGGDGGGVVLQNCPWGERALSIAREVLLQFGDDMELFSFKTTPRGYIYVRLDKLSNEYGCPSIEELESYSHQYKRRLDEVGASGEIPGDLALEVSSPGAERLLKVPEDLHRFKDMPMRVSYVEDLEAKCPEKNGVFFLNSVRTESGSCVWRMADVKENRDPSAKGRPLSHKQKDWRLELPYAMFKRSVVFYISLARGMALSGDHSDRRELRTHESLDELRTDLADYIADLSEMSVKERGVFAVALSGGSLIGLMGYLYFLYYVGLLGFCLIWFYASGLHIWWKMESRKLCEAPYDKTVDWAKWYIFWADERVVGKNHDDSNYKLAKDGFLSKVPIVPSHVHSINDSVSAEQAADDYEFVIRQLVRTRVISVSEISDCPKFDLVLLGMGPDGHIASLFPNHSVLGEDDEWVTFITDSPKPPPERITFTLPVINSASNVAVVATGISKAEALHLAIDDAGPDCPSLPARMVQPTNGKLVWFLDKAAASKLDGAQFSDLG